MEEKKKNIVEVTIEEHLARTIQIEIPEEITDQFEREEYAEEKAREMYVNEEIVLDADDANGIVLMQTHDMETDIYSEWIDMF